MSFPFEIAFTEWSALGGTILDKARARKRCGDARDRQFQFAFEDFVDSFLGVGMLMDRRAGIEFVMGERHVGGIEPAVSPAG